MGLTLVSAPAENVVSMSDIYDHLRVDVDGSPPEPEDADYIAALRNAAEAYLDGARGILGRALVTQTWDLTVDRFPSDHLWVRPTDEIVIPLPPLQSVSSISYVDPQGATQTLSSSVYQVVTNGEWTSSIVAAYGQTFPETRAQPDAVTVRFVAGFGDAADVPTPIVQALKLLVSGWYENRSPVRVGQTVNEVPMSVAALLSSFTRHTF